MFKGSKNYNKEKNTSIWTVLQNVGGKLKDSSLIQFVDLRLCAATINATTWNDRTNYFELLPKEHLEVIFLE